MKKPRPRVIAIHYNKGMSTKGLPWTVHLSDRCIPAAEVSIEVPTTTVFKPEKASNPRAWIRAVGHVVMEGSKARIVK